MSEHGRDLDTLMLVALPKHAERRAEHAAQTKLGALAQALPGQRRDTDDGGAEDLERATAVGARYRGTRTLPQRLARSRRARPRAPRLAATYVLRE